MALNVKKPTDHIKINSVKILIYGQPGTRKTSYSFTAPKPLSIDFDGGIRRVRPEHRGEYIEVTKWEDVMSITKEDIKDFDSIIIDTVGKALDFLSEYLIRRDAKLGKKDGNLSLQGYGALKVEWSNFLKKISIWGKHIVMVAHDKEAKNGDDTIIRPDISGSSLGVVVRDSDLVGYVQSFNNQSTISFTPTDAYYGKNTCGFPDRAILTELTLTDAFAQYELKVNEGVKDIEVYNEQMSWIESELSHVKDAADLNDFVAKCKGVRFVIDGALQCKQRITEAAQSLNCKLNKDTKVYE